MKRFISIQNTALFVIALASTVILAAASNFMAGFIPYHLISAGVFAMLLGMALNPLIQKLLNRVCTKDGSDGFAGGLAFVSKTILKAGIVLMGFTLSFSQVLNVGKFSLIVMSFTLVAAFGFGNLFGRLFKMNWKLSNLISAGTGICGGSAIAAIAPVIDAEDSDIAYAISATFLFDIIMVIAFPIMGRAFEMTDLGYGLWAGTAVNDTSSVVAAGYAFLRNGRKFCNNSKAYAHPFNRSDCTSFRIYKPAYHRGAESRNSCNNGRQQNEWEKKFFHCKNIPVVHPCIPWICCAQKHC